MQEKSKIVNEILRTTLLANDRKNCQILEDQHGKRPVKTNAWESSKSIKEGILILSLNKDIYYADL